MSALASIVDAMLAAGCDAAQIAAAVRAAEAAKEARRAALREGAAERQRRRRERLRSERHAVTARDPLPLIKESPPHPERKLIPTPCEGAPAREAGAPVGALVGGPIEACPEDRSASPEAERLEARRKRRDAGDAPAARRLPADFAPSLEDFAFGRAEGLSEAEIARTLEDLRLWAAEAVGPKALRADWSATFRRFLRRDSEAKRAGRPPPASWRPPMAEGSDAARTIHVRRDSPQGEAWWAFVRAQTGRTPPMDRAGGWRFPSEWPPGAAGG